MPAPASFSLCFTLTFGFMAASFAVLAMTREPFPSDAPETRATPDLPSWLRILRDNANFRAFLGVRILSQFAGMGFAFYVIYAVRKFGVSDATAASMVAILLLGQVLLGPVMGRLGDRWSHRGMMAFGALGAALSAVLAWRAQSPSWFYGVFLLEAAAIVAIWTIPLALSVGFAADERQRPLYIGLSNTLPAPAAILAPVVGGWIADAAGYETMFLISALAGLLMALALWLLVHDPQREATPSMGGAD
jgi:MFS family permease